MTAPTATTHRWFGSFYEFVRLETAGGLLLLLATAMALAWANSPWAGAYHDLWHLPVQVGVGGAILEKSLAHWVNDGLMAVFFFVVGLEIKREVLVGELASVKRAALPAAAALGGMVVPALLYVAVASRAAPEGWGVPMATDIAFALGVLALLGSRVPVSLKIFLTAVAIVDDLGAVLVIALFYTGDIAWLSLAIGGVIFGLMIAGSAAHIRYPAFYAILGAALWLAFLKSGVHATVAGVLAALTIPSRRAIDPATFETESRAILQSLIVGDRDPDTSIQQDRQEAVQALAHLSEGTETPLQRLEHALHPWVTFFIMPVFALANAGVTFTGGIGPEGRPAALGIVTGLVVGKPLGIALFSWLSVRMGLAALPSGVTWRQLFGVGALAGIGFTMSLFIAELAFDGSPLLDSAKLGILGGSVIAGLAGAIMLLRGSDT